MYPSLRLLFCFVLSLALLSRAPAQSDGAVDPTFVPPNITYGQVNMVVQQPDGKFLVAGDFTLANGTFSSGLARFNADGSLDTAFSANLGNGFDGPVIQVALTSTGKIICGGNFFGVSGFSRPNIAQLNSDGTLVDTWNVGSLLNPDIVANPMPQPPTGGGTVGSFVLLPDDKILLTGTFRSIGATFVARAHLARFNDDGTHDATFDPGTGLTIAGSSAGAAGSQILLAGTHVYLNGNFDNCNGVASPVGLSRMSLAGVTDANFFVAAGPEVLSPAGLAAADASGRLFIGGSFATFNGVARRDLARLNLDGTVDTTFNAGDIPGGSGVFNVEINAAGLIYVSGGFNSVGGVPRRSFVRLQTDGSVDTSFNPGSGATNGYGSYIKELSDGRVFCGGGYGSFNGTVVSSMAITSNNGVTDATFAPTGITRGNSFASAVAVQPDGKVLLGGFYSLVGGLPRQSLIRLNTDGTIDPTFNPGGVGGDNSLRAIILRPDGKIYVCGQFRSWNNVQRLRIARLNADGTLDTGFDPGLGLNNIPYAIAEQADGKVVVVGAFTTANGVPRAGIARFNADGSHDLGFDPGTGFGSTPVAAGYSVFAMALQSTGQIIAGGFFGNYNGTARNGFVRINSNGSIDPTFTAAPNTNTVRAITVAAGDKIYVGGGFTQFNATVRQRVALLNADGTLDATFAPTTGNVSVRSILPLANGQVYIGGLGQSISGPNQRRTVARLNANGTLDPTFDAGAGANGYLYASPTPIFVNTSFNVATALALRPSDSSLYVAGSFQLFGGKARTSIVRLGTLLESFLASNFTPAERSDPLISGLTADPDGDGIQNLAELAFNLNPRVAAAPTGGPTVALVTQGAFTANQITFRRLIAAPGITYAVEVSGDLQSWTTGASQLGAPQQTTDGITQLVTFRDNTPISGSVTRRFMRVRVTKAP